MFRPVRRAAPRHHGDRKGLAARAKLADLDQFTGESAVLIESESLTLRGETQVSADGHGALGSWRISFQPIPRLS